MLKTILDTVFNSLLMGTSGYVMFVLQPPEHPFTFAAAAVGFCHGCAGIYTTFFASSDGSTDSACKLNYIKTFTTSCMEIVTVPLINMDLYGISQQTSSLALGHGLFIIPLAFDLTYRFYSNGETEDESTAILKDLTILGNIVSLLFFAVNENNLPAGVMALSAFFAYYGSIMMENVLPGTEANSKLAGYALFLGLIPDAIRASGGAVAT